jgi:transcriptional regulator with XRE-family HTH domain
MPRCTDCDSVALLEEATAESWREIAGHRFVAVLPARRCGACEKVQFESAALRGFELRVAAILAEAGAGNGPAFRFMRKALGMRATELAQLLDVSAETISRWETEKRGVDRGALALLCGLVRDALAGRTHTLDQLRVLCEPRPLEEVVRLDTTALGETAPRR